jgi:HSP20 family molecular chaperone IbpA
MSSSLTTTAPEAEVARRQTTGEPALTYQPHVDVYDTGSGLTIRADIPGASADSIDVAFEDGVLAVHAKAPARDLPGRVLRQEYGIGDYRRSFRLGDGFDGAEITAEYRRGVLSIDVPRLAAVRPRKVAVRVATASGSAC